MQKYLFGHGASKTMVNKPVGKPVVRNGVPGHIVMVAPKAGYGRFVPSQYKKSLSR